MVIAAIMRNIYTCFGQQNVEHHIGGKMLYIIAEFAPRTIEVAPANLISTEELEAPYTDVTLLSVQLIASDRCDGVVKRAHCFLYKNNVLSTRNGCQQLFETNLRCQLKKRG